jgi:DNA adenine methylase
MTKDYSLCRTFNRHDSSISLNSDKNINAKPFLRWAGSKRKQIGRLASFWSVDHVRYIEPFAGSACLFFKIAPHNAILGDNNHGLIEVYRVVRDQPEKLYRRLCRIGRNAETYYRWRRMSPKYLDTETRALRFLYLNRNCFNGIFRTNIDGDFNVPFGKKTGAYFSKADLLLCASLLKRAKLVSGDFTKTIEKVEAGDFVYLDPPFAVKSRRVFREYGISSFENDDVPRLANVLQTIENIGADFLFSYADCSEARKLAKIWNAVRLPIRRNIAGFADHRRQAYEWLITNMVLPLTVTLRKMKTRS